MPRSSGMRQKKNAYSALEGGAFSDGSSFIFCSISMLGRRESLEFPSLLQGEEFSAASIASMV